MDRDDDYLDFEVLYAGLDDADAPMEPSHFTRIVVIGFVASVGLMALIKPFLALF